MYVLHYCLRRNIELSLRCLKAIPDIRVAEWMSQPKRAAGCCSNGVNE